MRIPVHSPWLPGYIDVAQTILVILTIAGLIPDRSPDKHYLINSLRLIPKGGIIRSSHVNMIKVLNSCYQIAP